MDRSPTSPRKRVLGAIDVYLEVGTKRIFASALDWPGWCRSGRDEAAALQALLDYGPRYVVSVGDAAGSLQVPVQPGDLHITERLPGDATTDFGAPHVAASTDARRLGKSELDHLANLLQSCWNAFDVAANGPGATRLSAGPRGGGRDVARMRAHVLEAETAYVGGLGGRFSPGPGVEAGMDLARRAFLEAAVARAAGELPDRGPRGGLRWTPRYAIRRSAWHALDHAWEIEDRSA